jgi:hypothetical protein
LVISGILSDAEGRAIDNLKTPDFLLEIRVDYKWDANFAKKETSRKWQISEHLARCDAKNATRDSTGSRTGGLSEGSSNAKA